MQKKLNSVIVTGIATAVIFTGGVVYAAGIAPYARGIAEYKIPYEQLKDVLNPSYAERL